MERPHGTTTSNDHPATTYRACSAGTLRATEGRAADVVGPAFEADPHCDCGVASVNHLAVADQVPVEQLPKAARSPSSKAARPDGRATAARGWGGSACATAGQDEVDPVTAMARRRRFAQVRDHLVEAGRRERSRACDQSDERGRGESERQFAGPQECLPSFCVAAGTDATSRRGSVTSLPAGHVTAPPLALIRGPAASVRAVHICRFRARKLTAGRAVVEQYATRSECDSPRDAELKGDQRGGLRGPPDTGLPTSAHSARSHLPPRPPPSASNPAPTRETPTSAFGSS